MNASVSFAPEDFRWLSASIPPWKLRIKRVMDIVCSSAALVALFPLCALIAAVVAVTSSGSPLYRQERVGRLGRSFRICKFRTMVHNASELGTYETSNTDPRITPVGRFLRRWSLDELPQLWNVLLGEMSLIGPRPTLLYQVEQYTPRQRRRLLVKPGMSGLAQVRGRNRLSWPERIELDITYIESFSFRQDIGIMLRTLFRVFSSEGVYGE